MSSGMHSFHPNTISFVYLNTLSDAIVYNASEAPSAEAPVRVRSARHDISPTSRSVPLKSQLRHHTSTDLLGLLGRPSSFHSLLHNHDALPSAAFREENKLC